MKKARTREKKGEKVRKSSGKIKKLFAAVIISGISSNAIAQNISPDAEVCAYLIAWNGPINAFYWGPSSENGTEPTADMLVAAEHEGFKYYLYSLEPSTYWRVIALPPFYKHSTIDICGLNSTGQPEQDAANSAYKCHPETKQKIARIAAMWLSRTDYASKDPTFKGSYAPAVGAIDCHYRVPLPICEASFDPKVKKECYERLNLDPTRNHMPVETPRAYIGRECGPVCDHYKMVRGDFPYNDIAVKEKISLEQCLQACDDEGKKCVGVSFSMHHRPDGNCNLKSKLGRFVKTNNPNLISLKKY